MEEARAVLRRLDRIEALERAGAPAEELLAHVRALLAEAEAWTRREPAGAGAAADAVERCRAAVEARGRVPAAL